MRELVIKDITINDNSIPFVIAEIGHNHMGDINIAKNMFLAAKEAGANAVKLQKRNNKKLFTKSLYNSSYAGPASYGDTYGAHREALEFGENEYYELKAYADELGLIMFSTAFDLESVDFLEKIDLPLYKIASADLNNTILLKRVAETGKPILLSTGGGFIEDVQRACDTILPINRNLSVLQCTASYPSEPKDMNLRVITTFRELFPDLVIGLSDHQNGISMALVAYALGARIFEKHFTLNRAWKGTDHAFSLEPTGLTKMVRDLGRAKDALGDGYKKRLECENKPLLKMSKKLVAARAIPAGTVLTAADVSIKSPGDGLPPYELPNVLGRKLRRGLNEDDSILFEDLDGCGC